MGEINLLSTFLLSSSQPRHRLFSFYHNLISHYLCLLSLALKTTLYEAGFFPSLFSLFPCESCQIWCLKLRLFCTDGKL